MDVMSVKTRSNILDPIHAELDPRVWDNPAATKPVLKPVHAHWIKREVYETLEEGGYTDMEKWLTLVFTGSLTTYQYSEESDVDISLFVDTKVFPEWSRAEMIALMVDKLDGRVLPGTPFPLQDFVVGEGIKPNDLYKPGLRSGYNIDNSKWIVPPEPARVHDVKAEQGGFYAWALQMADKMERLLRYEPEQAIKFWHSIHKKRQIDMKKGKGDYAESNIIYKMLANRGLFPTISEASGEYIAKIASVIDQLEIRPNTGWFDEDGEWKDRYREVQGQTYDTLADKRGSGESRVAYLDNEPIASLTWIDTPTHAMIGTAYTHPDYRGQGIFDHLAQDLRASGKPVDAVKWHNRGLERHVQKWAGKTAHDDPWQSGLCETYAAALLAKHPEMRLGIGGYAEDYGWNPQHFFAHDDTHAYDSLGKHPLPYYGIDGQFTHVELNQKPEDWLEPIEEHLPAAHRHIDQRLAGKPIKPPNLRQGTPSKNCLACKMYHKNKGGRGKCWGYGEYDVRGDQLCDSFEKETRGLLNRFAAHSLQYDRDLHPEGKGFILGDGSVWTWPTENLKPMHTQYSMKAKQQGQQVVPGSAFHIKEGKVWQYGPGRTLSPEQQQVIFAADPTLELAPSRRQEQLDAAPGFGHGQNVLDILERDSSWKFSATNIPEIARRIYEKALEGVGATVNLHGETPTTRYGFAPDRATDTPIAPEEFSPQVVEHFIAHWADRLRQPDKYVGSWVRDDGMIVLDVSEGHDDFNEAMQRAQAGEQEAIWDGHTQEAIPVPPLDSAPPAV